MKYYPLDFLRRIRPNFITQNRKSIENVVERILYLCIPLILSSFENAAFSNHLLLQSADRISDSTKGQKIDPARQQREEFTFFSYPP